MTAFLTRMVMVAACLLVMPNFVAVETVVAQSSLKKCPKSQNVRWHNCFGKWSDGKGYTYEGEFKDDKYNGQGSETLADGTIYVGNYVNNHRNGQFTVTYANGDKYVGEFKDSLFNGQGTYTHVNGDKYVGEFKDDKRNGQGTFTFASGDKYVGAFKDDKYNGQGTLTLANGGKYVGEFKDDKYNGQGTFTYANGDKYVGEFKDNKFNGQFSVLHTSGDSFVGEYISEKRSGQGSYAWKDGSNYRGQWKDGLPTNDGMLTNSSGTVITGAQYKSAAVYDADGYMSSPDVLTYSGGTVQQQVVQAPNPQSQPIAANDNLRKVALVIGNGAYNNAPQLANPENDAKAMSGMLSSLGFKVITAVDATKSDMEGSIRDFLREARSADLSLLFYSGHGIEVGGENFLLPIDAKLEEEAALSFEVINSKVITNSMGGERQIGIILLDACRDNPFTKSLKRSMVASRAATVSDGLAPISSDGGGLVVAFATAPGDTASDGEGANSPFTTALLKWMPEKGLEIELMMKKVKSEVSTITNNDQRPWTNSDLTTEVYLAGQ